MKLFIGLSLTTVSLILAFAFSEMQQSRLLTQQIDDYARQNSQLLTQIENNSLQKLETANALQSLQSELNNREGQIAALSRQMTLAQQQADPDYEQVEARIRQQLSRELQASNWAATDPRVSVLKQLLNFDPMEMGEIITINAQYGGFLKSLNISEERMAVVINALSNMLADQNQARSAMAEDMRANPAALGSGEFQERMQAISEPEAQIEALSYELTELELNAFSEYQEQKRNSYNPFFSFSTSSGGTISTSTGTTSDINFISTEMIEIGSGQSGAIQLLPAQPVN